MIERIRLFFNSRPNAVLWLLSFAYTFPVYNKYWAPFDEGIIAVAAQRLLAGEIPYKDFFIVMYPPGQIYVLAALFKIFSCSLIAGRIYTVLLSVTSSMLVFFMTRMLTKNRTASIVAWFIALTSLGPRLGAIPAPIWPGVLLGLFSIYIFILYLKKEKTAYLFMAGVMAGAAVTFRHDIGIFASIAIILPLIAQAGGGPKILRRIIAFVFGASLIVLPWVLYLIRSSASRDMFNSLITFTSIHQKTASMPFPRPCLDLNMIFHGSLQFININQFYIPVLIYGVILVFLALRIKSLSGSEKNLSLLAILLFGIFTFNQARIRPDPAHLLSAIEPSAILFGFLLSDSTGALKRGLIIRRAATALILFLFLLLSIKNIDKCLKNTYTKVYKKSIVATKFDRGTIYVPKEEQEEVLNTLQFIRRNTDSGDRIYVGNIVHWKDDFGGNTLLYFLADRLPCTKFYELLPGLITDGAVQREIVNSLKLHDVKLLVLQDVDVAGLKADSQPKDSLMLDNFIKENYRFTARFGRYSLYTK